MAMPIMSRPVLGRFNSRVTVFSCPSSTQRDAGWFHAEAHQLDLTDLGWPMSAIPELAAVVATAQVLRATARAVRGAPRTLGIRLYRAADTRVGVVTLAVRYLERIEQLEQEVRRLLGGDQ
jgi:hypothetical protein